MHYGTVFAISADGELTSLHTFNGDDGVWAVYGLVQGSDGYMYGVSDASGTSYLGNGTLFRLSTKKPLTLLHLFKKLDGTTPSSAPIFGSDGRLYGTTADGGLPRGLGYGTVYAFDPAMRTPELHFCYATNPSRTCPTSLITHVGYSVTLSWISANVAACRANGAWNGIRRRAEHYTFRPTQPGTFVYRLDCTGPNGHVSAQTVLTVR